MALGGRRVISQYRGPGLRARGYLHVRWLVCPFDRVLPLVPTEGRLLDVGCGSGLWLTYLAQERPRLELHGVDPDARKLTLARTSAAASRLHLRPGSVEDVPPAAYDVVTMFDVLCLVPDEVKLSILNESFRALKSGGTVVIKDADTRPWWKYAPTALEELIAVHVLRMTVGRPTFHSLDWFARELASAGFRDVETRRVDRGYVHTHVVLRARKP
ncbi:MAG: class I SAM-dependent methyltransferase [Gemmatimonadetes bacterium]|nr:class I SAM-dependent methyltransferase [Gemmatimonadota bacterium]